MIILGIIPFVQLAFQTGYASIKSAEVVDGRYNVVIGPPNNEVAEYLREEHVAMFKGKDPGAYIDALFLGKYEWACKELLRTLRELSADMVPHNGTATHWHDPGCMTLVVLPVGARTLSPRRSGLT